MLGESIYHFSGLRMWGTESVWSMPGLVFGKFFMYLWASASLLVAVLLGFTVLHFNRVRPIVSILGFFSFFHAGVLWFFSTQPLAQVWQATPAVFVYNSWYTLQLKIEASILLLFGIFVCYGVVKGYLTFTKK